MVCDAVCANRSAVAAEGSLVPRLRAKYFLSVAAEHCKSYWNGRKKVAMVICQSIFLHFDVGVLIDGCKTLRNRVFSVLASRSDFGVAIVGAIMSKNSSA